MEPTFEILTAINSIFSVTHDFQRSTAVLRLTLVRKNRLLTENQVG